MSFYRLFVIFAVFTFLFLSAPCRPSFAAMAGSSLVLDLDLGMLVPGDAWTYGDSGIDDVDIYFSGELLPNSMVVFSYDYPAGMAGDIVGLWSDGIYGYREGEVLYEGDFHVYGVNGTFSNVYSHGFIDGEASEPLAFSYADMSADSSGASLTIMNMSAGVVDFLSGFRGIFSSAGEFTVSYNVSAVPLPASLPLFGFTLAVFCLWYRRKAGGVVA